jgi:cyclopropane-fatty-acyl-phospholipid synthase
MAFRYDGEVVFQLQLARRQDAVPLTRDYMMENERRSELQGVAPVTRSAAR